MERRRAIERTSRIGGRTHVPRAQRLVEQRCVDEHTVHSGYLLNNVSAQQRLVGRCRSAAHVHVPGIQRLIEQW